MSVLIAVWRSYCKLRRTWVKQQTSLRINSSDGRTDERTNGKPMDLWPRRYPPRCKWTVSIDREASIIPPSFSNRSILRLRSWNPETRRNWILHIDWRPDRRISDFFEPSFILFLFRNFRSTPLTWLETRSIARKSKRCECWLKQKYRYEL